VFVKERFVDALVDHIEELLDLVLGMERSGALAVEIGLTEARLAVTDICWQLCVPFDVLFAGIVGEHFVYVLGYVGEGYLADVVECDLEEADLALAEGEHVEAAVFKEHGQERCGVKTAVDFDCFFEAEWDSVVLICVV